MSNLFSNFIPLLCSLLDETIFKSASLLDKNEFVMFETLDAKTSLAGVCFKGVMNRFEGKPDSPESFSLLLRFIFESILLQRKEGNKFNSNEPS